MSLKKTKYLPDQPVLTLSSSLNIRDQDWTLILREQNNRQYYSSAYFCLDVLRHPVGGQKTVDGMVEDYFMLKYLPGNSSVQCIYKISLSPLRHFRFLSLLQFSLQVFRIHQTDEQLFLVSVPKPLFCVQFT